MPDIVSAGTRSRMMAGIRGRNTRPELTVRRALFRRGFRYRLHVSGLPGRPDLVFPRLRAVIQIHGCFWHAHDCHLFKWPSTRRRFWRKKIEGNHMRDRASHAALQERGWRILTVWECALKGKTRLSEDLIISTIDEWLRSGTNHSELRGEPHGCPR